MNIIKSAKLTLKSIYDNGISSTFSRIFFHVGRLIADKSFDKKYGVETCGTIQLKNLRINDTDIRKATWYEPMSQKNYNSIMSCINISHKNYAFVDIGSGKGKVLLLASTYPFNQIQGVEFSNQLNQVAKKNVDDYSSNHQQCFDIQCICADAIEYDFPHKNLILFFYSPFSDPQIMQSIVNNILTSLKDHPRHIIIIFHGNNPGVLEVLKGSFPWHKEMTIPRDFSRAHHYGTTLCSNRDLEDFLHV